MCLNPGLVSHGTCVLEQNTFIIIASGNPVVQLGTSESWGVLRLTGILSRGNRNIFSWPHPTHCFQTNTANVFCFTVCLTLFAVVCVDANKQDEGSRDLTSSCCRFLCYFCRTGRQNQKAMFDNLGYLLDHGFMGLCKQLGQSNLKTNQYKSIKKKKHQKYERKEKQPDLSQYFLFYFIDLCSLK